MGREFSKRTPHVMARIEFEVIIISRDRMRQYGIPCIFFESAFSGNLPFLENR
jgi:hypothetical protein